MIDIYHTDYLELFNKIPSETISLVLTDPPFGINYKNQYTHKEHEKIAGDEQRFSYELLAKEAFRVLKPNTAIFCFTGWSEYPHHYYELESAGFSMKEPVICQKRPAGSTSDLYGTFQPNSDWCMFAHKGRFVFQTTNLIKNKRAGSIPNKGRKPVPEYKKRFPSCWFGEEYPWSSENSAFQKQHNLYHPTIKNKTFLEYLILLTSKEDDTILDPFLGSGSCAVACASLKRNFIGCDISEEYCEMAKRRIKENI
jgi:DNA modification methylase